MVFHPEPTVDGLTLLLSRSVDSMLDAILPCKQVSSQTSLDSRIYECEEGEEDDNTSTDWKQLGCNIGKEDNLQQM